MDAARDEVLAAVAAHVARAARAWCEPVALAAAREADAQRLIESVAEQIERGVPPPALNGPADQDAAWQRLARVLWEELAPSA